MIPLTRPLTAVDIETDSANPAVARIVQIAIIRLHPDGTRDSYATLVNPGVPIPADATAIHGITNEMVKDAPTWAQLAPKLIRAFQGADVLGYNAARFDLEVLRHEFTRVGVNLATPDGEPPQRVIDPYVIWQKKQQRRLADAVQHFLGVEHTGAHDALADIEITLAVFEAQLQAFPDLPQTPAGIHDFCFPRDPNAIDATGKVLKVDGVLQLSFGKHKGVPLSKVPKSYITWLLGTDLPQDAADLLRSAA
jgi:DNA polymerase-3 subunit epsilon